MNIFSNFDFAPILHFAGWSFCSGRGHTREECQPPRLGWQRNEPPVREMRLAHSSNSPPLLPSVTEPPPAAVPRLSVEEHEARLRALLEAAVLDKGIAESKESGMAEAKTPDSQSKQTPAEKK